MYQKVAPPSNILLSDPKAVSWFLELEALALRRSSLVSFLNRVRRDVRIDLSSSITVDFAPARILSAAN